MQIVIDIPEDDYEYLKNHNKHSLYSHILNGIILPKRHGRLIDANYEVSSDGRTIDTVCGYMAPTIIEADKAEGSDEE